MEKALIINWRWSFDCEDKIVPKDIIDSNNNNIENEVCYLSDFEDSDINIFNKFLKELQADSILLLLHEENGIGKGDIDDFNGLIFEFSNGIGNVYKREDNDNEGIIDSDLDYEGHNYQNGIPAKNFKFVWKSYYEVKPLEEQKKKLINLWLPLAIDLQGLSEVQNDLIKAQQYFKEIKKENDYLNSLNSFPKEEDFPRWEEIKNELNNDYRDFNPVELVKAIKLKDKDNLPILDPSLLTSWLKEVVSILDTKINQD